MPEQQVPVCVDGRLSAAKATGVASYAQALGDALAATGAAPLILEDDQRGRFGGRASFPEAIRRNLSARVRSRVSLFRDAPRLHAPDVFRLAQVRFAATGKLLMLEAPGRAGIMHWTYPIPAWIRGWVNLYTIHDGIPLTTPDLAAADPSALARKVRALAAVADRFLTVSSAAREQILTAFELEPSAVTDCGTAITALAPGTGQLPPSLQPGEYYLFCGLAEPRKNLPRLVSAWRKSGTARPLVLTGPDHSGAASGAGVMILPYQERPALIDLIRHARALLFPSLSEGFGLPVAEAMALGTPVLTSRGGALEEVAAGSALLVDPLDVGAIAAGIARLDREDRLRSELSALGRERARAFTVQHFGARLRRLHDEFASDSRLDG